MGEASKDSLLRAAGSARLKSFLSRVFEDLESLEADRAMKIPLSDLPDSPAHTLTVLQSVAQKRGIDLGLRAERDFLYVWNPLPKSAPS